ncbi:hypothetical protein [Sporomusa acidovorans]|uniref:Uncharacterized protein n=1 Tax=Sporomusa acidovorans (strain ATCC 49682 / DSM 3132 / Mol) TaxID=1123286 RepID=A0ABZ3J182_SPOA4|nr:hypothetical protein [Sporomusa acidovorans]OZC22534.1 hypothetical protein SPACI_13720 [Sporomusa acidovorans DSM 3132]SDE72783.1 hypothetical protein SAMN04488499_10207 [Sporomusa acidovorans]
MATKDMLDSNAAKKSKAAATITNTNDPNKAEQKKHMPCKNSLPT